MLKGFSGRICAAAMLLAISSGANANFHLWQINEIYSNADGTVQFIELITTAGGQQFVAGHAMTSSHGATTHTLNITTNLPGDSANKTFLIGTQGFAALNVVTPDYVVPNGFLFTSGGTLNWGGGADIVTYPSLPTDGRLSINRIGVTAINSPKNFAGVTGTIKKMRFDFDGDGKDDILWRNSATGENYIYLMNGTAIASEGFIRTVADLSWQVAGIGDFDGDGKADILWRNSATGENYIYFMDGTAIKPAEGFIRTVADQNWQVAGIGDFDGDGNADILWRNSSTGQNYIYPMSGLTIKPSEGFIRTVADPAWTVAGVGDFDGDGKADILWRNAATGQNYVYPMNGTTILGTEGYLRTVADTNWQVKAVADFDGDGKADILWRHATSGQNYLYPMNGATILGTEGYLRTVADLNWGVAAVGDYDGDGKADILWRNSATGANYLYPMNGTTILGTEGYVRTVADLNWRLTGAMIASAVKPPTVASSSVTVNVLGVAPSSATGAVSATDPQNLPLAYSIKTPPQYGSATIVPGTGAFTYSIPGYAPAASDAFAVTVSNGRAQSTAQVNVQLASDPLLKNQWHIQNVGQDAFSSTLPVAGNDMNVAGAWLAGYSGKGIKVGIADTGLEAAHEDLAANVDVGNSYNFLTGLNDPSRAASDPGFDHGTAVAGIIGAVAFNGKGGRGVAYGARLRGYNFLAPGAQSVASMAKSLGSDPISADNDLFNASFGAAARALPNFSGIL